MSQPTRVASHSLIESLSVGQQQGERMNNLFRGVVAVTGCVLLAGASVAETQGVGGDEKKNEGADVPLSVSTSPKPSKPDQWSMREHPNPLVGKEETKDLMRGKRPK